jgi:hypothetical protein
MASIDLTPGNNKIEPGCMALTHNCHIEENNGHVVTVIKRVPSAGRFGLVEGVLWEIDRPMKWEGFLGDFSLECTAPEHGLMRLNDPGNLAHHVAEDGSEVTVKLGA